MRRKRVLYRLYPWDLPTCGRFTSMESFPQPFPLPLPESSAGSRPTPSRYLCP